MYRLVAWLRTSTLALCLSLAVGCFPVAPADSVEDTNVGLDPNDYPQRRIRGEPNDTFSEPVSIVLNENGRGQLSGRVSTIDDVDVYALEGLGVGDRIIVDVGTHSNGLDADLAIFDEEGRLAFKNDDRSTTLQQLDPFLNDVIRHPSSVYFLVIAGSPLAVTKRSGNYEVLITVSPGNDVLPPTPQTVLLNFDGGSITFSRTETIRVSAFDAGDLSNYYVGKTTQLRRLIAQEVRDHYAGLALEVVTSPDDPLPTGPYSTILFGGSSSEAFGLSQGIDSYNNDQTDEAIVFTNVFRPSQFGRLLSVQELATAIGNVAAHELGHLLGLHHVANIRDLMDTTGGALTLIVDQDFLVSPLDDSIYPIGLQDAWLLLAETLGLTTP